MRRRRFHPVWAIGTSLCVFLLGSLLPEWWTWLHTPDPHYSFVHINVNFWEAVRDPSAPWQRNDRNSIITAVLLLIAVVVGLLVYWIGMDRRRPVDAADYKDATGGAIPDGRVNLATPSDESRPTA